MIYTVTFNPSLDYIVSVPDFRLGRTNRTASELLLPGGKGINVSILLKHLGIESTAFGFCAGFTGVEIRRMLAAEGVKTDFVMMDDSRMSGMGCINYNRINLKLRDAEGTEINGMGPVISQEKLKELMDKLERLKEGDVLVLAGSISASMPPDIYSNIARMLNGRGVLIVADATGSLLLNVLEYHPFLIKPNNHELGEIFGVELTGREAVIPYAGKLQEKGAANVLVSMAGKGAVLAAADGNVYMADAPKGKLVNGVGAGDSMVAGFVAGWIKSHDYAEAFRMGVASGSASAFSEYLADKSKIDEIYEQVSVDCMKERKQSCAGIS